MIRSASLPPIIMIFVGTVTMLAGCAHARTLNGFDLSEASIPASEVFKGGPPRDGIPALNNPRYINASDAFFLESDDRVMGVRIEGDAYAYPLGIMNYHEIVNHETADSQWLITYCPLCGTGMVFDAQLEGRSLTFGVSGLLYNNDLLMYDRQTESLWSQIEGKAVSGPLNGTTLELKPSRLTTWADWRERHPETQVLSRNTGHQRDYDTTPYGDYEQSSSVFFPLSDRDDRYHPKSWTIGMESQGEARAWPFEELEAAEQTPIRDTFNGQPIRVHYDADHRSARITDDDGNELASTTGFWFAWYAFHPETSVFTAGE